MAALGAPELGFVLGESRCDNAWQLAASLLDANPELTCRIPTPQDFSTISTERTEFLWTSG